MTGLVPDPPIVKALCGLLDAAGMPESVSGEVCRAPLPSSREVWRFTFGGNGYAVVGKFFTDHPPANQGLAQEYDNYRQAAALGLTARLPRLLGRSPEVGLGLLLEAIPGPELDALICRACRRADAGPLWWGLSCLAQLLAFFHSRPGPETPVSGSEALGYLDKVLRQLAGLRLLTNEDSAVLAEERCAWQEKLAEYPDRQVLVHGDATATNFLFPDGRQGRLPHGVVALDLERLRFADRLWDLSWVAGELKHAWTWRTRNPAAAEEAIGHFFQAYLAAWPGHAGLGERLFRLNPFYMALAELRIARNAYLAWDHRRWLVEEARRCLWFGRRV